MKRGIGGGLISVIGDPHFAQTRRKETRGLTDIAVLGNKPWIEVIGRKGQWCLRCGEPAAKKRNSPSGASRWKQIGRELRNVYPAREKLPPQLRSLAKQLEHKVSSRRRNRQRKERE